ncbi:unnamed protein product [Lampetra fluviatilis]
MVEMIHHSGEMFLPSADWLSVVSVIEDCQGGAAHPAATASSTQSLIPRHPQPPSPDSSPSHGVELEPRASHSPAPSQAPRSRLSRPSAAATSSQPSHGELSPRPTPPAPRSQPRGATARERRRERGSRGGAEGVPAWPITRGEDGAAWLSVVRVGGTGAAPVQEE